MSELCGDADGIGAGILTSRQRRNDWQRKVICGLYGEFLFRA